MKALIVLLSINIALNIVSVCLLYNMCDNLFEVCFDVKYLKNTKSIENYVKRVFNVGYTKYGE